MSKYKHYSFDLWLTLIKSNPLFKKKRAEYFHKHFNRNNKSVPEIEEIIRNVDIMCNYSNEIVGKNIDAFEMYAMVLYSLGFDLSNLSHRDIQSLYHTLETMFFEYSPVLYSDETLPALLRIKQSGASISILSNTGFIRGFTLRKLLKENGIGALIDFDIYSDEFGLSKPNQRFYSIMLNALTQYREHNPITQNEIIHIGDNEKADYKGALQSGIHSFLINSNNKTINDIP